MKSFRTAFLLLLVLLPSLVWAQMPVAQPEEVGFSQERLQRLSYNLKNYVDKNQLSGNVTLVMRKGKVAYFEAFGMQDIEAKVPMAEDAIFRIASQTKAMISVAIMILQEQGQLLISDPVGKYIPTFMETTVGTKKEDGSVEIVDAKRPITLRDLLTHTAGIGYGYGDVAENWQEAEIQGWYFAHRDEPIQETVMKMGDLPFNAQPGERFVYGYNTDILGAVVEIVSGEPLDEFIASRILKPLKMNDTYFYLPKEKHHRLATVYSSAETGITQTPDVSEMVGQGAYTKGPQKSFSGGAGLLSTANDYATFLAMMLNNGEWNGVRILSRKSVELMTVDHISTIEFPWANGMGFGLGFSIIKDLGAFGKPGSVGAYGWGGAYHSTYWVDPAEELVVVYFTQLIPAQNIDDHDKLRALVYQAIID